MNAKRILAIGGGLLLGLAGVVNADTPSNADLQAQIKSLQNEVTQLKGQQDGTWLNERRAEEVKALVKEVLADADTRASLAGDSMTAGHNGTNFFMASPDGMFTLKIWGLIQVAYIANFRNHPEPQPTAATGDLIADAVGAVTGVVRNSNAGNAGFRVGRAQVFFDGTIGPPQFMYSVGIQADKSDETDTLYHAWIGYKFQDAPVTIRFGEDNAPFMHETLTYEGYSLATEKSLVNSIFGLGQVQGLWLEIAPVDMIKIAAAIHDGSHSGVARSALTRASLSSAFGPMVSGAAIPTDLTTIDFSSLIGSAASSIGAFALNKDFDNTATDFAGTIRVDFKVLGTWDQYREFASVADDQAALFFGGAFDYEKLKTGASVADDRAYTWAWTVDTTFKFKGLSVFASATGAYMHVGNAYAIRGGGTTKDSCNYGVVLQAGYLIPGTAIEPFGRWEYIDLDNRATASTPDVHILTFGANYYFKRQAAKLTAEVVWSPTSLSGLATGFANMTQQGLLTDYNGHTGQIAAIIQFQLMY
jgi:hypothetical protein